MWAISNKKFWVSVISAICLFLIINFAIRWSVVPQTDNPVVSCSTTEIPTVKTDFLYSDFLKRRHNFHTDVNNELINIKSVVVKPDEELKVIFNQKPLNYTLFKKLDNGNYDKVFDSIESTNGTFTTASMPGKYVFSISANYTEGLGIYYFSVEVVEK